MGMILEAGTKRRILQAARALFAERGFKGATVRDICKAAGANAAAVCYHFGGKEELYVAVLHDYMKDMVRRFPRDLGVTPQSTPQERLRAFVRSHLSQTAGGEGLGDERLGRLLMQEILEPSEHFSVIFEHDGQRSRQLLLDIVGLLLPGADEMTVSRCASSIIGQCLLFDFFRKTITRMAPELELKAGNIQAFTDFIVEFSLGGIVRLGMGPAGQGRIPLTSST